MSKTMRLVILIDLFLIHLVITVLGVRDFGYVGLFEHALRDWAAAQVFSDLSLALLIASMWLVPDARKHGINPWGYVLGMLPLGSFAPLGYLIHRELVRDRVAPRVSAAQLAEGVR